MPAFFFVTSAPCPFLSGAPTMLPATGDDRRGEALTGMRYNRSRALELLRLGTGLPRVEFRDGQEEAIRHVVEGDGPLLIVQRTGWGKSFVYFIAAKLLRERGHGPALLISPLLSLMRNQIAAAGRMGIRAETINTDNNSEWEPIEERVRAGEVDVLLISPERLGNQRFNDEVLAHISDRLGLLVIDEAHCISDWGHDFRPDYRRVERIARMLPPNIRMLATTATATDRVLEDLKSLPGLNFQVHRGDLNRPSLLLQTIRLPNQAERLAWLAERLSEIDGSGIIYTLTIRDAERVANWLCLRGFAVEAYTGESGDRRPELEQALLDNDVKALVATTALGMGFDKPDLAFVFHYQAPGSAIHYYQQVGRAGRALDKAYGVLLSGPEELDITDYFIDTAFPSRQDVEQLTAALEQAPEGLSVPQLMQRMNIRQGRIEKALQLLSLESPSPVVKEGARWQLTPSLLGEAFWERVERLTALRRKERAQMQEYVALESGHMEFLIRALDGDASQTRTPALQPLPTAVDPALTREAVAFLRRMSVPIEPRRQWPSSSAGEMPKGNIPDNLRASAGRALCMWEDVGWGTLVRDGKYRDGRFSDELVDACARLVQEWAPSPAPAWVVPIPSRRRPELVPEFAERLARALGLPCHPVLERTREHPEQKGMENGTYQALNVFRSLGIRSQPPPGPVLLIDDIVDSRWTITVAAHLLRSRGSGEVWPLSLSRAGGNG